MKTLAALLAAKLLATGAIAPRSTTIEGNNVVCFAFNQREIGARKHAFVCVELFQGEVRGAVLKRNGVVFCTVTGTFDGSCLTLTVCGQTDTRCG